MSRKIEIINKFKVKRHVIAKVWEANDETCGVIIKVQIPLKNNVNFLGKYGKDFIENKPFDEVFKRIETDYVAAMYRLSKMMEV